VDRPGACQQLENYSATKHIPVCNRLVEGGLKKISLDYKKIAYKYNYKHL
jgi:hypothetical protein